MPDQHGLYQFSILDLRFWIDGQQPCKGSSLFIGSLTSKNWYYAIALAKPCPKGYTHRIGVTLRPTMMTHDLIESRIQANFVDWVEPLRNPAISKLVGFRHRSTPTYARTI
ncbi:MAG: hypothetical protein ACFE0I_02825 [Elainellaceae cyanobacterium]